MAVNPATPVVGAADPQCLGQPYRTRGHPNTSCGLGTELALLLPSLVWLLRRRSAAI